MHLLSLEFFVCLHVCFLPLKFNGEKQNKKTCQRRTLVQIGPGGSCLNQPTVIMGVESFNNAAFLSAAIWLNLGEKLKGSLMRWEQDLLDQVLTKH